MASRRRRSARCIRRARSSRFMYFTNPGVRDTLYLISDKCFHTITYVSFRKIETIAVTLKTFGIHFSCFEAAESVCSDFI